MSARGEAKKSHCSLFLWYRCTQSPQSLYTFNRVLLTTNFCSLFSMVLFSCIKNRHFACSVETRGGFVDGTEFVESSDSLMADDIRLADVDKDGLRPFLLPLRPAGGLWL